MMSILYFLLTNCNWSKIGLLTGSAQNQRSLLNSRGRSSKVSLLFNGNTDPQPSLLFNMNS